MTPRMLILTTALLLGCGATPQSPPAAPASPEASPIPAAAPIPVLPGPAPDDGWYYAQVRTWQEIPCAEPKEQTGMQKVDATIGLHALGEEAALYVIVHREGDSESRCTSVRQSTTQLREAFEGKSEQHGGLRRFSFAQRTSAELPLGANEYQNIRHIDSKLVLDCVSKRVEAYAYDPDDGDNSMGFTSEVIPGVTTLSCSVSEPFAEEALFDQWMSDNALLLAAEPGMEWRSARVNGEWYSALRVGSPDVGPKLERQHVSDW